MYGRNSVSTFLFRLVPSTECPLSKRKSTKCEPEKELLPIQPGDMPDTCADMEDLVEQFDFKPSMDVKQGVENFAFWYKEYNKI